MKFNILFVAILIGSQLKSQTLTPNVVSTLPPSINESSGLEKSGPNFFWSHNDSGGQPEIYGFDSSGVLLKTIDVTNATNNDWEDIAQGDNGEFYIGDFGNNSNNRSTANGNPLRIYIITDPDLLGNSTTASIIEFEYKDRNFSAPSGNHNFDMEGFFYFNDSLHLFTKNRTSPTNGWIKHYKLPTFAGTHQAILVDSFNNGGIRITSADISPDKKSVILIGNNVVHLFTCYSGSKFLSTSFVKTFSISNTQKEAVVFANNKLAYLTDEQGSLYRLGLYSHIDDELSIIGNNDTICYGSNTGEINIIASGGTAPYNFMWSNGNTTSTNNNLIAGNYIFSLTDDHGCKLDSNFTIYETNEILFTSEIDSTCFNSSTGSITVTATGITTPYTYLWSNSEITNSIVNLTEGSYDLEITDTNGCTKNTNFNIYAFDEITISSTIDSTCANQNNGAIYVSILNGDSPFSFQWSTNETSSSISNLYENNYDLTISDSHGCIIDTFFTVSSFHEIQPNLTIINDAIFADQNNLNNWYLNGNLIIGENTDSLHFSQNGFYQVTYIDHNGCEIISDSLEINTAKLENEEGAQGIIIQHLSDKYFLHNGSNENIDIEVFSIDGKFIQLIQLNPYDQKFMIAENHPILIFRMITKKTSRVYSLIK